MKANRGNINILREFENRTGVQNMILQAHNTKHIFVCTDCSWLFVCLSVEHNKLYK